MGRPGGAIRHLQPLIESIEEPYVNTSDQLFAQSIPNLRIDNAGLHNYPIRRCDNSIHRRAVGVSPPANGWPVQDDSMVDLPTDQDLNLQPTNFWGSMSLFQVLNPEP